VGQLHPAVGAQVGRGSRADEIRPVLAGDAVHDLFLAKSGLIGLTQRVYLRGPGLLELAVKGGVIKLLAVLIRIGTVCGFLCPLRRQGRTAAAADRLTAQGALAAGRAGAQLTFLIRELPLVSGGVGRGMDAAAELFITIAVIRRAAVGADNDVVLQCQRLAAALTGAAIIFGHKILPVC